MYVFPNCPGSHFYLDYFRDSLTQVLPDYPSPSLPPGLSGALPLPIGVKNPIPPVFGRGPPTDARQKFSLGLGAFWKIYVHI